MHQGKAELYSSDSAEDSENERTRKGALGKIARKRFESGLRAMTGNREEIARLMEFAMVHADAAEEVSQYRSGDSRALLKLGFQVCDIICQSLVLEATPVPRKLARLHLISDILHNSVSCHRRPRPACSDAKPHVIGISSTERLAISTRFGN